MEIVKASHLNDYQSIEQLAFEIIPEFYADIIPHDHNIFFVQKFQTVQPILQQISNGFEYYLIKENHIPVGYFGIQINKSTGEMILSKLYILKSERGKGFGTKAMEMIIDRAKDLKIIRIILTVNRKNERTINLYKKSGFVKTKDLVNQFENGHTILDDEMTKTFPSTLTKTEEQ